MTLCKASFSTGTSDIANYLFNAAQITWDLRLSDVDFSA
jgi:hypothetical protein